MSSAGAAPLHRAVRALRALLGVGFILMMATCRDGMEPQVHLAPIAVAPVMPSDAMLASFGLAIDRVRFVVVRPSAPPDTLVDTTVALPPDSATLDLALAVPLIAAAETLDVSIIALSGTIELFEGTAPVEVTASAPTEATEIPVDNYIGPGAGVDSIVVVPAGPLLFFNDSLRFQVEAFQAGVPVTQFYVSWTTSDTTVAKVNGAGLLRAPAQRTSVRVIARTPGAVASDSTTATFVPVPNQILIIAGAGQSGPAGQPLPTQLEVEVRAADNLPVPGVDVRFRSLSGGGGPDTIVTSDAQGRARTTAVLGATPGPQQFQASLPDFPSVPFAAFNMTATGVVISPATSLVSVASPSVVSGNTVKLRLQGKDTSGADITTGGATVVFTRSGGGSTGSISATADSGNGVYTAVFTGLLAGTATTIGATINGAPVTTALPTIAVSPGTISPSGSLITVSSGTVASGNAVMLRLRARDAAGNVLSNGGATVVFSAAGGSSTGNIGVTTDSGTGVYTAPFTGVLAGSGTFIGATIDGNAVTSGQPAITVTPGAPAQLAFINSPSVAATGVAIEPALQVAARDLAGNATPSFVGDITIGIGTNPGSGSLAGTLTQTAVAGVATFADLAIDLPGIGYTLSATAVSMAADTTASFDVVPPSGTIFWANAAGGNWSNPANWSGGAVPSVIETAAITLPGNYTITLDVSDTIAGLELGASSGTQTLLTVNKTLHVSGTTQINATGVLDFRNSTLEGGTLSNGGTVLSSGSSTIQQSVVTSSGSLIRVQGNNFYGLGTLTVTNGFSNTGAIILTDTISTYGATLSMPAGVTLINGSGGTMEAAAGSGGPRTLALGLDNQGTVTLNGPLTLNRTSTTHANSGTIAIVGGDLTVTQSGASPSFTTSGAISIGAGRTMQLSNGAFNYIGGTIAGPGTLALSTVNAAVELGLSTGTVPVSLTNSTVGGGGFLSVASGTALEVRNSTINVSFLNQGFANVTGGSAFNGAVVNSPGATLRVQGNNVYGLATLAVANDFTNDGTIVLTDTISTYGATLSMPAGATLTNAAGGTIDAAAGFNGTRTLALALDNQGTVTLNHALAINRGGAVHSNNGTIDISGGDLTVTQTGATPSFTTSGTITIAPARTMMVSGGAFNYTAGTISGGTLSVTSGAVTSSQPFNTATAALTLINSTWGGSGTITVGPATLFDVRNSTVNAPLDNQSAIRVHGSSAFNGGFSNPAGTTLTVQGNNSYGLATLTVGTSFGNGGAIVLTDTISSYGATLSMPAGATLTNAAGATIEAAPGFSGPRTLALELDNQGTVTLNQSLTLSRAGAGHLNTGTIDVSGGDFTLTQSGTTPSFGTAGSIIIGAGRTFSVSSGAFDYSAGTISGGGTLSLSSTTVTAAQDFSTATNALSIVSSTWGGTGTLTVGSGTSLLVRSSSISTPLVNLGTLISSGTSTFSGPFTTNPGTTLRVQGNNTYGLGTLTIADGFTNTGAIELTDTISSYGATLNVTAGTLLNAPGGTIAALLGSSGPRTLGAQLDNQGAISVASAPSQGLTLSKAGAGHVNSGTIAVSGGDFAVTQSGTTPSFTNTGAISVAAGDTFRVSSGAFSHDGGTLGGAGAMVLSTVPAAMFNVAHSIAALRATSSTVSFATPQNTGSTGFVFISSTVNGPGTLTNAAGQFLNVQASTLNLDVDNQGTLLVNSSSAFNGVLTTAPASSIRIQGNNLYGLATLTVGAFTNNGTIELTDTVSSYGATLSVPTGTLTNSSTGTIAGVLGSSGPRTLAAQLNNQGAVTVGVANSTTFTWGRAGASQVNSGVIDVTGGDLVLNQSAGTGVVNTGTISVAAGDTLRINGGQLSHDAGTFGGPGTLVLTSLTPAAFNVAHTFATMIVNSSTVAFTTPQSTAATAFSFGNSTVNGPALLTNDPGKTLSLRSTTVNAPFSSLGTLVTHGATSFTDTITTGAGSLIRIQGEGLTGLSTLTVTKGFENAGTIELTDTVSSYGATLAVPLPGKLLNLAGGFVDAVTGANGPRTLTTALDNQGSVRVNLPAGRKLTLNRASAAHVNSGAIDVGGGDLAVSGAASFQNLGAVNLVPGDSLLVTGGAFSYDAGSLGAGTMVLSSVNPATFSKPHQLSSIILNSTTASFAADQSTDATAFTLNASSLGGSGTLTNGAGKTISMRSSSIAAPFVNQGALLSLGNSSIDGPVTTAAGSTIRIQGDGLSGLGTLTIQNGLVNNGTIELTDVTAAYGATLVVKTLPLVNAGSIDIQPGANGPRTIDALSLDNQGIFTASQAVTISHADAQHTNRGTYKVKAGAITFAQSGTNESFTNQAGGIVDIDPGTVFRVTNGPVTNALGGKIVGFGTFDVRSPATFSNDGEIIPGASPGTLTIAGNMQIPTSGTVTIELGGPVAGTGYDQLAVTGSAIVAEGTLNVATIGAFNPAGQFFDVVTFATGSGSFRTFTVPPGCGQPFNTGTSIRVQC